MRIDTGGEHRTSWYQEKGTFPKDHPRIERGEHSHFRSKTSPLNLDPSEKIGHRDYTFAVDLVADHHGKG